MVRGICRFWAALRGYRVAYFGGQHVAAWRRRCNGDRFRRTTVLDDAHPLAGSGGRRVDSSTGGDYTPDAGCGSHSFPVDCATGRLSTELHHLLRIAAFLLPCGVCPLTSHIARLHVIPPMARPRGNGPPRGDRPVYPGALCLLYGVSRRVSPAKPHPRHLTGFYVIVSLGGAAGGLFVGLLAPNVFHAYYEFPIGLALCALTAATVFGRALWSGPRVRMQTGIGVMVVLLAGYFYFLGDIMFRMVDGYKVVERNFYGQLRVADEGDPRIDDDAVRKLIHGVITHGQQMLRDEYRRLPVTYFCPESGIGRGMRALEGHPRRIGILGLGCGTLAAYGRPGDTLRIYEINPKVLEIANRDFTYLKDTPAKVEIAMGDGRLVLEGESTEPSQLFDILVMDAFSGDSVPVHLITKEAFAIYFRHLKPTGIRSEE